MQLRSDGPRGGGGGRGDRRRGGLRAIREAALLHRGRRLGPGFVRAAARRAGRSDESPVFYLATPPSLFGPIVEALGRAGLSRGRARRDREAVRVRPGVGARAERTAPPRAPGGSDLPDRPLPGEGAGPGHRVPAVRERDPRTDLEPAPRRVGADHPRGVVRRRGPGQPSTTRWARCAMSSRTTCCRCSPS